MFGYVMSSKPGTHIQVSFLTLHCDIFHLVIISSLFFDIIYHHWWYSLSVFSFVIAYLTLSLFHLEWWFFTHHCMEDCHVLPPVRLMSNGSEILFWEVLLVRIRVTSVHGESLFIWLCISWEINHYWSEYAQKKKKIAHCSFYYFPLGMCMDMLVCFIGFMC